MDWLWYSFLTALFLFLFLVAHRIGYIRGHRQGMKVVLAEWKKNIGMEDDRDHG